MQIIKNGEIFMLIPTQVVRACILIDLLILIYKHESKLILELWNNKKKKKQSTQNSNESEQKQTNTKYIQRWIFDI